MLSLPAEAAGGRGRVHTTRGGALIEHAGVTRGLLRCVLLGCGVQRRSSSFLDNIQMKGGLRVST